MQEKTLQNDEQTPNANLDTKTLSGQTDMEIQIIRQYIESEMFAEAETHLKKVLESGESKAQVHYYLGVVYLSQLEYAKAEKQFLLALEIDPGIVDSYFNLGMLYQRQAKFDKALSYYKAVVEANIDDAETYYLMGQCAQCLNMTFEAREFLSESFRLSPTSQAALDLSIILIAQEEYDEAEKILTHLIDLLSNQDEIADSNLSLADEMEPLHFTIGLLLKSRGKYEEAIKSFYSAIMINDQNEQSYNYLGECCFEIGMEKEAETFFSKASKLVLSYIQPVINLGRLYYKQARFYQVVLAMQRALEIKEKTQETENKPPIDCNFELVYNLLGQAYMQLGEKEKAREAFETSIQLNPNQPEIVSNINSSKSSLYEKTILSIDD